MVKPAELIGRASPILANGTINQSIPKVMTKKDYSKIAKVILDAPFNDGVHKVVRGLIHVFEDDNPKFNRELFLLACGYVKSDSLFKSLVSGENKG